MCHRLSQPTGCFCYLPAALQDLMAGLGRESQGAPHHQLSPSKKKTKKTPSPEGISPVVGHHSFVISSLPAIPGILHKVPLPQNSASGRVRRSSGQGNHMNLAIIHHLQIMSSISQSGAYLVGRQEDFYGIRTVKFYGGLS